MNDLQYSINYILSHGIKTQGRAIYEFGLFKGHSLAMILDLWGAYHLPMPELVYGFDSFMGLPEENEDCSKFNPPEWTKGFCSAQEYLGGHSIEQTMEMVRVNINYKNTVLVPGYWCDSLKDESIHKLFPDGLMKASLVHLDGDLYSSTLDCLIFLFKNRIICKNTIINYNDWGGTLTDSKEFESGESKAHKEIVDLFKVKCREIHRTGNNPPHIQTVFIIDDYEGME